MRILDLYAGAGGERRRSKIEARGHFYVTLDLDPKFKCNLTMDMMAVNPEEFLKENGHFDLISASPPCTAFSVASIGHHWGGGKGAYFPKTPEAIQSQALVVKTIEFINHMKPIGWFMENPRGVLRKLPCVAGLARNSICFCKYGDTAMKPTDIWGHVPGWVPRPMCHNGHPDHDAAPRGARTGTQGKNGAAERAVVPWQLWADFIWASEGRKSP